MNGLSSSSILCIQLRQHGVASVFITKDEKQILILTPPLTLMGPGAAGRLLDTQGTRRYTKARQEHRWVGGGEVAMTTKT